MQITSTVAWSADRITVVVMLYLAFIVNEVKIKMESHSVIDYKAGIKRFQAQKRWIYAIYLTLVLPTFVFYVIRGIFKFDHLILIASFEFVFKLLFAILDGFLVYRFMKIVLYFRDFKIMKIKLKVSNQRNLSRY